MIVAVDEAIGGDFPGEATNRLLWGFCEYLCNYLESYDAQDRIPTIDITPLNDIVAELFAGGRFNELQLHGYFPTIAEGYHALTRVIKPYLLEYLFSLGYLDETITFVQYRYISYRPTSVGFTITSEPIDDTGMTLPQSLVQRHR